MTLQELHDRTGELLKTHPPDSDILLAFKDISDDTDLAVDLENLEPVTSAEVLEKYGIDYDGDNTPILVLNHNADGRGEG